MITLVRRELWESPVAFKWAPVGMGVLIWVVMILTLIFARSADPDNFFTTGMIEWMSENDLGERREYLGWGFLGLARFFGTIMFAIILFYLAHSLYDDRKDRSILFWKSLPVSDTQTVLSKLATACLLVPLCFFLAIAATWVGALLIASIQALIVGVNPITALWLPAINPHIWALQLSTYLMTALWLLPVYGWLLFCSAWAPRVPILIAFGVPMLLGLFQHYYSWVTAFRFPDFNLWTWFFGRIGDGLSGMTGSGFSFTSVTGFSGNVQLSFSTLGNKLAGLDLWLGVAAGTLLIAAAIGFRKRATDN